MAFKLRLISVVLLLCLMTMQYPAGIYFVARNGCNYADAAYAEIQIRRVLGSLELKNGLHGLYNENLVAREMRMVPSGPDPLHHNGGSPKKPRTP